MLNSLLIPPHVGASSTIAIDSSLLIISREGRQAYQIIFVVSTRLFVEVTPIKIAPMASVKAVFYKYNLSKATKIDACALGILSAF